MRDVGLVVGFVALMVFVVGGGVLVVGLMGGGLRHEVGSESAWDRQLVETCNPVQMVHRWKNGSLVLSQLRCVTHERPSLPVGETKK